MSNKILILKNIEREGPGLIASWFDKNDIDYDTFEVNEDLLYSDFHTQYVGLVVLGGPASANDKSFVILRQLEFIEKWLKSGRPYLGVCLGMQLMIKTSGGKVFPNKVKEIGFFHNEELKSPYVVKLNDFKNNPLKDVLPKQFEVFQLHGETVSHSTIESLADSKFCNYQICSVGEKQFGVQFHFELSEGMLRNWIVNDDFLVFADKDQYVTWYRERKEQFEDYCFALMKFIFGSLIV